MKIAVRAFIVLTSTFGFFILLGRCFPNTYGQIAFQVASLGITYAMIGCSITLFIAYKTTFDE